MNAPLRVCYFGTHDPDYPRNSIVVDGLRANGVEVFECNIPLWAGSSDKLAKASGGWMNLPFLFKVLGVYLRLIRRELAMPAYDVMLVGYPGQIDMYLARLLSWRRRVPLAFDVLMSLYLLMQERDLTTRHPVTNRLTFWIEKGACNAADRIIMDTQCYVDFFCNTYSLPPDKFRLAPLGADERVYYPLRQPRPPKQDGETEDRDLFKVNYYGTFIPVHGVESIVEAAWLLRDRTDIQFEMIGDGPLKAGVVETARRQDLGNIVFVDWVDKRDLLDYVADADISLGVFGTSHQSQWTVPNKIWEGLAMAKPVVTGDSLAVRQVLTHGQHVYLCRRADGQALADAILALKGDPALCHRLARTGHDYYTRQYTMVQTGLRFKQYLSELVE